jgi:hypothetical protein
MGPGIAPAVLDRLGDERWYVVRNMLGLLSELPVLPPEFDPWQYLQHKDARVRREAMRLLLRQPEQRDRAIVTGLRDTDDGIVRLTLTTAVEDCPEAAIPLVVTRAASGANADQRVAAIRVLGAAPHPTGLQALLQITAPKRGLLGARPPSKTPEYLAALAALAQFPDEPRAQEALALAAKSRDPDVVRASRAMRAIEE